MMRNFAVNCRRHCCCQPDLYNYTHNVHNLVFLRRDSVVTYCRQQDLNRAKLVCKSDADFHIGDYHPSPSFRNSFFFSAILHTALTCKKHKTVNPTADRLLHELMSTLYIQNMQHAIIATAKKFQLIPNFSLRQNLIKTHPRTIGTKLIRKHYDKKSWRRICISVKGTGNMSFLKLDLLNLKLNCCLLCQLSINGIKKKKL